MHKDIHRWIEEIRRYNPLLNLVSSAMISTLEEHVENTMEILAHINEPCIADIGSGSGLPAIPYKIMNPDARVVMIERSEKKCIFLRHILDMLDLKNTEVIQTDLLTGSIGEFEALMSRAFSPLETLEKAVMNAARTGTRFYYLSTGGKDTIGHPAFLLTDRRQRCFSNYTLFLDTYEIISQ